MLQSASSNLTTRIVEGDTNQVNADSGNVIEAQYSKTPLTTGSKLKAFITSDKQLITAAQRLRYRVFSEDMGAAMSGPEDGIDADIFDSHCLHLVVISTDDNRVVGYSRLITTEIAAAHHGFYSATEFDLTDVIKTNERYLEVGRTCIDSHFRGGNAIAALWAFIYQFMVEEKIDFLIGCVSIPLAENPAHTSAVIEYLRQQYFTVESRRAIPKEKFIEVDSTGEGRRYMPSLLKAYLRLGVKICGDAAIDHDFNVADVLVLLASEELDLKYLRRIMR